MRQWTLMRHLAAGTRARRVADIASAIGASWRTVYRDLECLQDAGFPIACEKRAGTSFWSMLPARIPGGPAVTSEEAVAIRLAAEHMAYLHGTGLPESLRALATRLFGKEVKSALAGPRRPASQVRRLRVIETLRRACDLDRVVRCRYYSLSRNEETVRNIHPYTLWLSGATVYAVAYCETKKDVRLFATDRIRSVRDAGRGFQRGPFDLEDYVKGALRVMRGGAERDIVIRVDSWAARFAAERPVHASQRLEELSAGAALLRLRIVLSEELVSWILGLCSHATVLEPEALASRVQQELESMLERARAAEPLQNAQLLLFPPPRLVSTSVAK